MTQQVLTAVEAQYVAQSFSALIYAGNYKGKNYYEHALHTFTQTKGQLTDEHFTVIFEMTNYNKHILTASIVSGVLSKELALSQLKAHNYDEHLCECALQAYQKDDFYTILLNAVKKLHPVRYRRLLDAAKKYDVLTASKIFAIEYSDGTLNGDHTSLTAEIALSFLKTLQMSN